METHTIFSQLPEVLLPWFAENRRDLPWRQDKDPYHIWVSEIMLQQTRVEAVKGYYARFLQALPTVADLAGADDKVLHKLWEGLGYYSRVRNLKKAAQVVMEDYGGRFPAEFPQVLALPGIGEYTAGAICSIAYEQPTPAVDGNVLRVCARLLEDATPIDRPDFKRRIRGELAKVYPAQAGNFTQALMELGATVCGPNRKPDCGNCPCRDFCRGCRNGTAEALPVKSAKKQRRREEMTVFIICCDGYYGLQKRPEQGLLAGLWQFPNVPGKFELPAALSKVEELGVKSRNIYKQVERKHIFTHVEWNMSGIYLEAAERSGGLEWFTAEQIRNQAALPTAFRQFWEETEDV